MLEYIKIAIETIDEDYKSGPKFVLWEDVRNFAKKNALLYMTANRLNEENAVALIDFTLTKTVLFFHRQPQETKNEKIP